MLIQRIASAAVLIPLVALLVFLGGWPFCAAIALVALLAGYEYLAILRHLDLKPSLPITFGYILLLLADGVWPERGLLLPGTWAAVILLLAEQIFYKNRPGSLSSWAASFAGAVYVGLSLSYFLRLRALEGGMWWVAIALVTTWISDSGAYFVGVRWGRHRLAPYISPKKSWEGVIGGVVTALVTAWALGYFLFHLPLWQGIAMGALIAAAATIGDLAESVIKRQAGLKDSSTLIPGHGGMLDRIDSLLFVAPILYYYIILVILS